MLIFLCISFKEQRYTNKFKIENTTFKIISMTDLLQSLVDLTNLCYLCKYVTPKKPQP